MSKYLTAPVDSDRMPSGIKYIIGNEVAERFSYYGMRTILVVFMTQYMRTIAGDLDLMSDPQAKVWYHNFGTAVYALPILGAIVSDAWLGKYKTILWLSGLYCAGHLVLAFNETREGLMWGLGLIALGSGGIKPCVSAHVGDQFGRKNSHLIERVFTWFYFSINFGSFFSTLLTPWLLKNYGAGWAFGVPGILMGIATVFFWMGRNKFVHIPPQGRKFFKTMTGPEARSAVLRLAPIYLFVAFFWSLFDQTGSAWVLQAKSMDRMVFGFELLPSQVHSVNPLLIMVMAPIFSYFIYPFVGRRVKLTPLRKIGFGLFLSSGSFAVVAIAESLIVAGGTPSVWWQIGAYVIITAAELLVSITALEFAYTQAPKSIKSVVMSLYLLSISLGNMFTSGVNMMIQNEDGTSKLAGASYYWFFVATVVLAGILFIGVASRYKERTYIQGDDSVGEPGEDVPSEG